MPRNCTQPGCGNPVERPGPCPEHARQRERGRGTPAERGYDDRWAKLAANYLKWHPWCAWVDGYGVCRHRATDVDHIVRRKLLVERGVANPDADEHLQGLCHRHHSMKTARETGFGHYH